ncbi:MAG: TonB-dependent receptor [Verrucomicrobia bacterium]|nr:TonB-dependent receptor [Verrucomicrobiota bacterium]
MRRARRNRSTWKQAVGVGAVARVASVSILAFTAGALRAEEPAASAGKSFDPFAISLDDLKKLTVEAASRRAQSIYDAPASVSIMNADDIRKYGYRTLAELLGSVRGFYVSYDRSYSFLGERGVNRGDFNNRVLVLIDGHRINNNLTDGGFIGPEFLLDVDLIEKVEIIRGASAVLYGNNAFFGVIDVKTRKGGEVNGAEVSASAGSFDTYRGRVTYGKKLKDVEFLLSASISDSEGREKLFFKEFASEPSHGIASRGDDESFKSAFGTVTWKEITLQSGFITREKGNPTGAPDIGIAFNDRRARATDGRAYVDLSLNHKFSDDRDMVAKLYYDRYEFRGNYPVSDAPLLHYNALGEWWGAEFQFNQRLHDRHTLTFGGEFRDDFRQESHSYDAEASYADLQRTRQSHGVYFQGDFELLKQLRFNAGVRYDRYGDFHGTGNPRLALIYNPFETSYIKAIYGTAFRAPNFFELIDQRNQTLKPENITTTELAWDQDLGKHFHTTLAGFYNQIDDLISLQVAPDGNLDRVNLPGADARGVEFEVTATKLPGGVTGRASYTWQETEDRNTHRILTDSPRHLAKLNVSAPIVEKKLFASLEFQYTTRRLTLAGADAGGFGIANFTLFSQNLLPNLEISGGVYNLFDRKFSDPATPFHAQDMIERDGRAFRVKLTYRF